MSRWKRTTASGSRWLTALLAVLCVGCATVSPERQKQADAHYQLGVSHLAEKRLQPASIEFQKAAEIDPNNRKVQYAMGHTLFEQSQYAAAEKKFRAAIRLMPADSESYNYLGKVYEKQGKLDEAMAAYRKALENPIYATPELPHHNLGLLYVQQKKTSDAIREFRDAIRFNPDFPFPYVELGDLYLKLGMMEEAVAINKELVDRFPDLPEANYRLAQAYLKSGAKQSALVYFQKVIQQAPDTPLAAEAKKHLSTLQPGR